jgi:excisionase family DNA binding protein
MNETIKEGYLTHDEAAAYLCLSPKTLYNKVSNREVKCFRFRNCKKNLYKITDLDALLEPVR